MRVLIADDHELLRDALAAFLQHAGISTEAASDLPDALARVGRSGPFDLILLDLAMPGMNGLEGLQQAVAANRGQPVALISGAARPETARQALALGAAGVLEKTLSAGDLVAAVRLMAKGGIWAQEAGERAGPARPPQSLTPREMQVLQGFCTGQSNREIAAELAISEPTVKLHARTLCRKLGAANRTQAAMIAREAGLF
ncbi:response regulator transcription factor [Gemmobacter nectariphilus]|uniref:response regulator transcription factor n=1 Tax=Gemmobacter nectariphilus TaxID=220343 RepID=UPI0003F75BB2|nr:response regulator transcription factor [Gemmobacter nectariphilus]